MSFTRMITATLVVGAAHLAAASTAANPTGTSHSHPCAEASASWAQAGGAVATVAASLAHACLESVPIQKDKAIELLDSLPPYLEWQTDFEYKKDPPNGYAYPGYDAIANLAKVKSNVESNKYKGEYEFHLDFQRTVFAPGHDYHFVFNSDILVNAFRYIRQAALVSISEDGISLPVIKLLDDVKHDPKTARVITKINGVDAFKYIEGLGSSVSLYSDKDATYNAMFYSKATEANGEMGDFVGRGRNNLFYDGPTTTFTFEDGKTTTYENKATVSDMTGVIDGQTFYAKFCTPKDDDDDGQTQSKETVANTNDALSGYPKPVIASKDGVVSGYYLTGDGNEDVAVITLTSFQPTNIPEFQAVVGDFLREASQAGKRKLIIDLQRNRGGYVLLGYDFFRQLFPHIVQYGFGRWRADSGFLNMAKVASKVAETVDINHIDDVQMILFLDREINYQVDLNLTNDNFLSFDDKFTPQVYKDTPYTALLRFNLSDPFDTTDPRTGGGIEISGYGTRSNLTQYFKAEDMIMLHDGVCGSTGSNTDAMIRGQGGVKSVVMGGRPKAGPMQGVGGVRGSENVDFSYIYGFAQQAINLTDDADIKANLARYKKLPMQRSNGQSVNVRDNILPDNLDDGTPAQYLVQEDECRLYWTAAMVNDVSEVWKATAKAAFNGGKCAYGAIPGSSSAKRVVAAPKGGPRIQRASEQAKDAPVSRPLHWRKCGIMDM